MTTFVLLALAAIVCMPRRDGLADYMRLAIGRAHLREYAAKLLAMPVEMLTTTQPGGVRVNRQLQLAAVRAAEVRLADLAQALPSVPDNDNGEPTIPRAPRLPCFEIPPPANREIA